jgi:hypothetical protein
VRDYILLAHVVEVDHRGIVSLRLKDIAMTSSFDQFMKPSAAESLINKAIGLLALLGIGPAYLRLLKVQGRRSGKIYTTPVNILELHGHRYLVGARGHTAWSKNASAVGIVTLRRGFRSERFRVLPLADAVKPEILKAYLDRYKRDVQRFFAVPAGSNVDAFRAIANRHPVFELVSA